MPYFLNFIQVIKLNCFLHKFVENEYWIYPCRSSRLEMFCKKGVPKNLAKFTGKHQCQSLFFNKVTGLRPATLKKETLVHVFSCEFFEVLKNTFFTECLLWMTAIGNQETQESAITRSRNGHLDLAIQQYQIFRGCPQNISGQFNWFQLLGRDSFWYRDIC